MGFFDKFIPKEVKKPFKAVGKLSKKFIPRQLRPFLPMATAFMPYTGIMGAMGGPMGFAKMYGTNLLAQQMADPDAEFDDLNQLSALLSGTHGGLMGKDILKREDVLKIATLPTLNEARAQIVGILSTPAKKIISILLAPGSKIAILAHEKSKKT